MVHPTLKSLCFSLLLRSLHKRNSHSYFSHSNFTLYLTLCDFNRTNTYHSPPPIAGMQQMGGQRPMQGMPQQQQMGGYPPQVAFECARFIGVARCEIFNFLIPICFSHVLILTSSSSSHFLMYYNHSLSNKWVVILNNRECR
jgi:hypothetical protein